MKNKGIYLAFIFILVGLVLCVGAYIEKGDSVLQLTTFNMDSDNDHLSKNDHYEYEIKGDYQSYAIECDGADIEIVKGSTFTIETWGLPKMDEGEVDQQSFASETNSKTYENIYRTHSSVPQANRNDRRILITLPETVQTIRIQNALGDVDVSNLDLEHLEIVANLGDVNVWHQSCQTADLTLNLGDLEWSGSILNQLDAHLDLGNADLTLPGTANNYQFNLDSTGGETDLQQTYGIDESTPKGAIVKVKTNLGDIDVSFNSN